MADIERYDPFDGGLGISLATRVGSLVYTSGMVDFDGATGTVPDDLEDEVQLAFMNLGNILEAMGTSFEHVVEQTNSSRCSPIQVACESAGSCATIASE